MSRVALVLIAATVLIPLVTAACNYLLSMNAFEIVLDLPGAELDPRSVATLGFEDLGHGYYATRVSEKTVIIVKTGGEPVIRLQTVSREERGEPVVHFTAVGVLLEKESVPLILDKLGYREVCGVGAEPYCRFSRGRLYGEVRGGVVKVETLAPLSEAPSAEKELAEAIGEMEEAGLASFAEKVSREELPGEVRLVPWIGIEEARARVLSVLRRLAGCCLHGVGEEGLETLVGRAEFGKRVYLSGRSENLGACGYPSDVDEKVGAMLGLGTGAGGGGGAAAEAHASGGWAWWVYIPVAVLVVAIVLCKLYICKK